MDVDRRVLDPFAVYCVRTAIMFDRFEFLEGELRDIDSALASQGAEHREQLLERLLELLQKAETLGLGPMA